MHLSLGARTHPQCTPPFPCCPRPREALKKISTEKWRNNFDDRVTSGSLSKFDHPKKWTEIGCNPWKPCEVKKSLGILRDFWLLISITVTFSHPSRLESARRKWDRTKCDPRCDTVARNAYWWVCPISLVYYISTCLIQKRKTHRKFKSLTPVQAFSIHLSTAVGQRERWNHAIAACHLLILHDFHFTGHTL